MRIARVLGHVTLTPRLPELAAGTYVIAEALDGPAVRGHRDRAPRGSEASESLVVFDQLGAGVGQLIAVSEGREAAVPFHPARVPIDAYAAAIVDTLDV